MGEKKDKTKSKEKEKKPKDENKDKNSSKNSNNDSIQLKQQESQFEPSQNPSNMNEEIHSPSDAKQQSMKKRGGEAFVFGFDDDAQDALQNPFGKKPPLRHAKASNQQKP